VRRTTPDRLLAAGAAVAGIGASGAIAYYIYVISGPSRNYWQLPGIASVVVLVIGLGLILAGLVGPAPPSSPSQTQRGGNESINFQAGGDIRVRDEEAN
jgi:hypothetical protein